MFDLAIILVAVFLKWALPVLLFKAVCPGAYAVLVRAIQ